MVELSFTSSAVPWPVGSRSPFSEFVDETRLSGAVVALEVGDVIPSERLEA